MSKGPNEVFKEYFDIKDIDPHGKKFDRVSRIIATSDNIEMELTLDVNTEIYPLEQDQRIMLALTTSLSKGETGTDSSKKEAWREHMGEDSVADDYEYVMYGKVYNYDDSGDKVSVYASFGGLLMCLAGDYRLLQEINVGQHMYLLIRKEFN